MKLVIAGGRDYADYKRLSLEADNITFGENKVIIVSGMASGADTLSVRYARENGHMLKKFPAEWVIGKHAGHIRNRQMAEYADTVLVFWDGKSKGTANMIKQAKICGKVLHIERY